ncbi:MAG: xanthine dehydrogenase, partial [Oribacterium parvum]|nr:xanthine dehydrogenase [Oribacterium parvum]
MRKIWQHIAELDPSRENVLLTSLNEENLGKKVLFIDGEVCAGAAEFRSEFLPFGKGKRGLVSLGERQFFLDPMG